MTVIMLMTATVTVTVTVASVLDVHFDTGGNQAAFLPASEDRRFGGRDHY